MQAHMKIKAEHLKRNAYLYVRQSTVRQVFENTESTQRQYALVQRAIALGWSRENIEVIDSDLGQSGSSAENRQGFQKLVAEVGLGRAGIVMGLEVSRLARNCSDWHRLIEICGLTGALILDEDGVYDPGDFNDRLLLGLKGTMSEAELHLLTSRLRGGLLNKARRGELHCRLPVGMVYNEVGEVALDPDIQIQESIHLLFRTFLRTGTAHRTVKYFHDSGLLFPRRILSGPDKDTIIWGPIQVRTVLQALHNPRYAGAFAYGRGRWRKEMPGTRKWEVLPREQWQVLIPNRHRGYISWEQYEEIDQQIRRNARAYGIDRRHGPVREGPALLQGRVVCGVCGNRMTVRYHRRGEQLSPDYWCNRNYNEHSAPVCQIISGAGIDTAVSKLLVQAVTPMAVEVALAVQQEIQARLQEADRLRYRQVERARYEAESARRRYMHVDPANRLVADSLEADWNEKLRLSAQAQDNYEHAREQDKQMLDQQQKERMFSLVNDFQTIWNDHKTCHRDRKRIVSLLVEDVTLMKRDGITAHVRFRGGATTTLTMPLPLNAWQGRKTPAHVVTLIDQLLAHHTDAQIAQLLNQQGEKTGANQVFTPASVRWIRERTGLKSYKQHLQDAGMLTIKQIATQRGVSESTVDAWRKKALLQGCKCDDKGQWLFLRPSQNLPTSKRQDRRLRMRPNFKTIETSANNAGGAV